MTKAELTLKVAELELKIAALEARTEALEMVLNQANTTWAASPNMAHGCRSDKVFSQLFDKAGA